MGHGLHYQIESLGPQNGIFGFSFVQACAHVVIIKGKIDADTMIIWKVNIALSDIEELKGVTEEQIRRR
ncbi:unnamed protein product [Rhizophagus irregularis]|nr:unnamed protein product [Rhizophagus irregularis]